MKFQKKLTLVFFASLLFAGFQNAFSQNRYFRESAKIFDDDSVAVISIDIAPESLNYILDPANAESDSLFSATFTFRNGTLQSETVPHPVGFRLRGNTSRTSPKKSFKVDFNKFAPGANFHGLEIMNINGEHNDPSVLRSRLSWRVFNEFGVPGARTAFAVLNINRVYFGLYVIVEHYDEEFIQSRFGNNDGNLYKCLWPADLTYRGPGQNRYKFGTSNRRAYELKINEELDDYTDLAQFITFLNITSDEEFARNIEERFNVRGFLKYLAVNTMTGMWDDYWVNKNNFYLYNNQDTGKFEFIPYDYDNTYGIDYFGVDWGRINIYQFGELSDERPLVKRILAIPGYRNLYTEHILALANDAFTPKAQEPFAARWHSLADRWIENDPFYSLQYGFTIEDFRRTLDEPIGGHVKYGIRDYISARTISAINQATTGPLPPEIFDIEHEIDPGFSVTVRCRFQDKPGLQQQLLRYRLGNGEFQTEFLWDDGLHNDGAANDGVYGALFAQGDASFADYYVKAQGGAGAWTISPQNAPLQPTRIHFDAGSEFPLAINEILASNRMTNSDEFGEFDDWIEIYNTADTTVSLNGFFLSDNFAQPKKWALPDMDLAAKSFLLIWTDSDNSQGALHTNFRLDATDGEQIGIFAPDAFGNAPVDTLTFGPQTTDVSIGRGPDGVGLWQVCSSPTPGAANSTKPTSVESPESAIPAVFQFQSVWPNPAVASTNFRFESNRADRVEIVVFDILGREVLSHSKEFATAGAANLQINLTSLRPGVYIVRATQNNIVRTRKLVIVP